MMHFVCVSVMEVYRAGEEPGRGGVEYGMWCGISPDRYYWW